MNEQDIRWLQRLSNYRRALAQLKKFVGQGPLNEPSEPNPPAFGLKASVVHSMGAVFSTHPEVEQAILYGSRAKGNYRRGSDIDLCLTGAGLTMPLLLKIENELDDLLLPYKIDLSIRDRIDNPELLTHIERASVSFYHRKKE
ncbi:nucleotidyltransferase domain-containing protein [Duganella vulcania]|nr:nucleotidyltransferase domain-containing protein [Duganella vulcania]